MWGISLDFLLPQSVTSSLYSSSPILQSILTIKIKMLVAYLLGGILILTALISFVRMLKQTQESRMGMFL